MDRSNRILFLTPYPEDTAGSQRFRFEQYVDRLEQEGFLAHTQSFLDEKTWKILYREGHVMDKLAGIIRGFLRRLLILAKLRSFDIIFIHREVTPIGPPIFEWLIAKVWRKKIIYDLDDAIWLANTSAQNRWVSWVKQPKKVNAILKFCYRISAGNRYIINHAAQFNTGIIYNPTTIDTDNRHLPDSKVKNDVPVIGWTGTHSTLKYLELVRKPLEELAAKMEFELLVIADKAPECPLPNQQFIPWNKVSEIEDLNRIDIGLMPLEDDQWAKGKCGFKALQFMALEKPVLVTPVGVNSAIVDHGKHGYHCESNSDWISNLKRLLEDEKLRLALGVAGRQKVIDQFSVASNSKNFLSLFN